MPQRAGNCPRNHAVVSRILGVEAHLGTKNQRRCEMGRTRCWLQPLQQRGTKSIKKHQEALNHTKPFPTDQLSIAELLWGWPERSQDIGTSNRHTSCLGLGLAGRPARWERTGRSGASPGHLGRPSDPHSFEDRRGPPWPTPIFLVGFLSQIFWSFEGDPFVLILIIFMDLLFFVNRISKNGGLVDLPKIVNSPWSSILLLLHVRFEWGAGPQAVGGETHRLWAWKGFG